MKIKLSFVDWKKIDESNSIYNTELGVEHALILYQLSMLVKHYCLLKLPVKKASLRVEL